LTRKILADYTCQGWALVAFSLGQKGPTHKGWQRIENCVTDPEVAAELDGNIGLCHAYSGTCAIDIDDFDASRQWLAQFDIDLDALWTAPTAVRLSSGRPNRGKLIYRMPEVLASHKIIEDKRNIIDFRCGTRSGTTVQDVLPPSIHPDTGNPYTWQYADEDIGDWRCLPDIPAELLAVWQSLVVPVEEPAPRVVEGTLMPPQLGKARSMLYDNDPDCDRDTWVKCGMALHHETRGGLDGFELWNEWSARSSKYKGRGELETVWHSFHYDTNSPITINSLRVDTAAETEEFEPIEQTETAVSSPALRTPQALIEAVGRLHRDKNGQALAILPNLTTILSVPEISGQHIAYDTFTDKVVCSPFGTDLWRPIRDTDYTATRLWLENSARFFPVSKELVRDTIYYIAESNAVDTAQKWLTSLKWDGVKRVTNFFPMYMGTIATKYERECGDYLWSALAGRIMNPGCQADMTPILVGQQGVGKSQGVKAMVPDPQFYVEIKLGDDDDKLARKMRGALIGELAELKGLHDASMEQVKAFITRTHEQWIPKYVEHATTFARRIVFIGTTNETEFLSDKQNRRWLPIRVSEVDVEAIKRDRDQLWAEAAIMWMENGISWRGAQESATEKHEEFKMVDGWGEIIENWIEGEKGTTAFRTHRILTEAIGLEMRQVNRSHEMRVGRVMTELGYERTVRRDDKGKNIKVWAKKVLTPGK
jgi:hypothetical protein